MGHVRRLAQQASLLVYHATEAAEALPSSVLVLDEYYWASTAGTALPCDALKLTIQAWRLAQEWPAALWIHRTAA